MNAKSRITHIVCYTTVRGEDLAIAMGDAEDTSVGWSDERILNYDQDGNPTDREPAIAITIEPNPDYEPESLSDYEYRIERAAQARLDRERGQ